jgi:hypothetical protein
VLAAQFAGHARSTEDSRIHNLRSVIRSPNKMIMW